MASTIITELNFGRKVRCHKWAVEIISLSGGASVQVAPSQNVTIANLYQLQWHQQSPEALWHRYASYSVTVTYQGKSRGPYKALFIFGHDAKGNEVVEPEDATIDPTGLVEASHELLFPDAFVITRLRTFPVVTNWLNATQMSGPNCSVGQGDVCCDLVKLKCGPGREDVANGLAKPLPDGSLLERP